MHRLQLVPLHLQGAEGVGAHLLGLADEGVGAFLSFGDHRVALLLAGGAEPTNRQVEVLLSSALESCEAYFQAFQFVVWSGMDAQSAVDAVLFETVGEA